MNQEKEFRDLGTPLRIGLGRCIWSMPVIRKWSREKEGAREGRREGGDRERVSALEQRTY